MTEKKAICIGINYPNDKQSRLRGCVSDAGSMASLALDLGFKQENIKLMIDEVNFTSKFNLMADSNKKKLYNSKKNTWNINNNNVLLPSKKNILKEIYDICSDKNVGMLFLSNSSHGTWKTDTTGKEEDGKSEIICALDDDGNFNNNGFIVDVELFDTIIKSTNTRSNIPIAIYFLIDTCHSGTITNLSNILHIVDKRFNHKLILKKSINITDEKLNSNVFMTCFSGCQDNQLSAENNVELMNKRSFTIRGYTTRAFELAIREKIINSKNINISCLDIYQDIFNKVRKYSKKPMNHKDEYQLPNFSTNIDLTYNLTDNTLTNMKFLLHREKMDSDVLTESKVSKNLDIVSSSSKNKQEIIKKGETTLDNVTKFCCLSF